MAFRNNDAIFNRDFLRMCLVRLISGLILTIVSGVVMAIVMTMLDD